MEKKKGKNRFSCFIFILIVITSMFCCRNAYAVDSKVDDSKKGDIKIVRAGEIVQKEWTIDDYLVDRGDALEVSVWQIDELHNIVIVRPDGRISFPLIGDVFVAGRTLYEIAEDIKEKLKTYIKEPQVSVIVKSFGGKKVVILGEVGNPGIIRFTEPIRMMEALALSGGYDESAGLKNVLIIRGDIDKSTNVIVVNVMAILKGDLRENIYLEKDDIIFLPRSFIGNVAYYVRQIAPLLGAAQQHYDIKNLYYQHRKKNYRNTKS
ncbi:polysaccharide biosynthesis/export family protein [Candidatus Omnitrophota bacterium]